MIGIKRSSCKNNDKKNIKTRIERIDILKNREFYFMLDKMRRTLC